MKNTLLTLLALCLLTAGAALAATSDSRRITAPQKAASTERRVALVIGNSAYNDTALVLRNPVNDATAMTQALQKSGFEVIVSKNADRRQMYSAINEFGEKLKKSDFGLFYYAGHGVQINSANYLLPVDLTREDQQSPEALRPAAVPLSELMEQMKQAGTPNVVVLDACRNNPFLERQNSRGVSGSRGLAKEITPKSTAILYATDPGSTAADGAGGDNGIFTRHLIEAINKEGLELADVMREVANAVAKETNNAQTPLIDGLLTIKFYFRSGSGQQSADAGTVTADAVLLDLRMWEGAQKANSVAAYRVYLNKYPNGEYAEMAKVTIASLERETVVAPVTLAGARAQAPTGASGSLSDEEKKFQSTYKSAERGDADAQSNLGFMYANGTGVAKDEVEAVKWYRKAAAQGDASGQNRLGFMYANGTGVAKDEVEAVKWYRKAAEQGYAKGQLNLGAQYDNGIGVAKDEVEAVKWYRKAADQGYDRAQNYLGIMYAYGNGVAKDEVEAVKWYRKAAYQGNAMAQNNLGVMYENGTGVAKDNAEAVNWYRKAAEQGDAFAQNNLKRLDAR